LYRSRPPRSRSQLGPDGLRDLYQATGAPLHASYALPQLCTYYDQHPDSPVVEWQSIASHCLHRWLEGAKSWPISYTEASWMGLLRTADCVYEPRALQLLPPTRVQALPKVADFDDEGTLARARLCPTYAQRWPALSYARFFLGLGDGACANVGSKCTSRHRIACTIGTSAAARVVWPAHSMPGSVPPGLFVYRVNRDYLLLGGALTDGGSIIAWIQELLHIQTDDELQACLLEVQDLLEEDYRAAIEGTAHRPVVMLPFLSGERSTNFQSGATGALLGLTRSTTRAHLVKSCLEGVTLRLAAIVRLIPSADAEIWVSGKALEVNTLWRQMIADCTGQTVVLDSETHEGSSRGAACLIATSLSGQRELVEEEATCVLKTEPRADAKAYWSGLVQSQESFLDAMRPIYASCS
jgi:gluconokinase